MFGMGTGVSLSLLPLKIEELLRLAQRPLHLQSLPTDLPPYLPSGTVFTIRRDGTRWTLFTNQKDQSGLLPEDCILIHGEVAFQKAETLIGAN